MPASLRFLGVLLVGALLAAIAGVYVSYRQDISQGRITAEQITGGHVNAGELAMVRYGCGACHNVSALAGPQGAVGPSLEKFPGRATIAGVLSNDPDHLRLWLLHPQRVVPGNAMPEQPMSERDARDLSAYLYTLRR
jgi:cytochrome c2